MIRDPLAAELMGRGIYHGRPRLDQPVVVITPTERDAIVTRLEMDREDKICTGGGSNKPLTYYQSIGAISCCEARKMVPVTDYLAEMTGLRATVATLRKRLKARRKPK